MAPEQSRRTRAKESLLVAWASAAKQTTTLGHADALRDAVLWEVLYPPVPRELFKTEQQESQCQDDGVRLTRSQRADWVASRVGMRTL